MCFSKNEQRKLRTGKLSSLFLDSAQSLRLATTNMISYTEPSGNVGENSTDSQILDLTPIFIIYCPIMEQNINNETI